MKMKYIFLILTVFISMSAIAQKYPPIKGVEGLLIIGKIDKPEDRYAIEVNTTKFLAQFGMKVLPSLNFSRVGSSVEDLSSDSIGAVIKSKGVKGYLLISVRGFDRTFKPREHFPQTLEEALDEGHLYPVFQEDISSITFEFLYYEEGKFVGYDIAKLKGTSTRAQVFEKLQKKLSKQVPKWTEPR